MLYPVYVHTEKDTAAGAIIPDFPGCFSAADDWNDLPKAVQEAVEAHFEGEDMAIPAPSALTDFGGGEYEGGIWVFVDIDLDRVNTAKERVNLSVPVYALRVIDEHVNRVGDTRSHFMYEAALKEIRKTDNVPDDRHPMYAPKQQKATAKVKRKSRRKAGVA